MEMETTMQLNIGRSKCTNTERERTNKYHWKYQICPRVRYNHLLGAEAGSSDGNQKLWSHYHRRRLYCKGRGSYR